MEVLPSNDLDQNTTKAESRKISFAVEHVYTNPNVSIPQEDSKESLHSGDGSGTFIKHLVPKPELMEGPDAHPKLAQNPIDNSARGRLPYNTTQDGPTFLHPQPRKATLKSHDVINPKAVIPYFMRLLYVNQVQEKQSAASVARTLLESERESASAFEEEEESEAQSELEEQGDVFYYEPEVLPTEARGEFYLAKHGSRRGATGKIDDVGIDEPLHRRWSRTVWRREVENLEPEYRLPALILKKHLYIKEKEPTRLGPGTYDVLYDETIKKKRLEMTKGLMKSCSRRFPKEIVANQNPGPGTYGYPYAVLDKAEREGIHGGRVTLLQSGPCDVRGKTSGKAKDATPGPGHYKYKGCIQQLLDKRISTRGPYDLYTPDRMVIPYGYNQTRKIDPNVGPGSYNVRQSLRQYMNSGFTKYKGRFSPHNRVRKMTGERIVLVAPLWPIGTELFPGPGQYDVKLDSIGLDKNQYKYGFAIGSEARPKDTNDYDMSPARYRPEHGRKYCPLGCGHRSVFKSTTGRLDLIQIPVLSERIRPKDLPPEEHFAAMTNNDQQLFCSTNNSWN